MNFLHRAVLTAFLPFSIVGTLHLGDTAAVADTEGSSPPASSLQPRFLSWPPLTSQNKPWTWWWWPGSAVDSTNIANQLRMFQEAGLGGVQIIPIYGIKGGESNYINFLSPEWMEMLNETVKGARALGMDADMALETGWCFGGPTISRDEANALVVERTFAVAGGEQFSHRFASPIQALMAFNTNGVAMYLSPDIGADGNIQWTAPPGQWTVYAISQRFSGQNVKRAAPGGRGPMLDPFYPKAMGDYLKWFDAAFDSYSGAKPRAVFQDSYEYQCNWSPDFFAQFERFRGYNLKTVLPALFGDASADEVARVKSDYRETVSDLMAKRTDPMWMDWAHRHGFIVSYQAHGSPGNWLDLYADADIPETEMFHLDRNPLISKFASSAAHVAGHPLTGAETGTWLSEHFTETLAELKYLADDMFISGVNHIFYHGCCYSPASTAWPGWLFYASTEMNPRNSIWHDVPALNAYIGRCQSILQSGEPDNDILLYWPISDLWNNPDGMLPDMTVSKIAWFTEQPIGVTAANLWKRGYAFDFISDSQLISAKTEGAKIQVPGGNYEVVLVPPCRLMPVETLSKLIALAQSGGTVIFESNLPVDVPGWGNLEERRAQFKRLLAKIQPVTDHLGFGMAVVGHGRIFIGDAVKALSLSKVAREPMCDHAGVFFMRRSFDGGWNYFIANRHGDALDGWVTVGHPATAAALLDPMTGQSGVAAIRQMNGQTQVYLQLLPGGSVILRLFGGPTEHAKGGSATGEWTPNSHAVDGPAWNYWETNGPATEITGDWNVNFVQGGPEIPASFTTAHLASWTAQDDTNAQRFAGSASYTITFDAPRAGDGPYFLDLGTVCQSARVRLNGVDYGTLIAPPFGVVIDNLKPRENKLEVEVTNVSANRIRDLDRRQVPWKIFGDIGIVDSQYHKFDAANWPFTDSGLLGPVTLTPIVRLATH
ncbi:MAG TPA: glycosyl hydrolase [Candidatus Sulfotelmatobacter sp.]|nr:glycosyl hydrolase [Candidatus Sulfotelmatobacter sp.]